MEKLQTRKSNNAVSPFREPHTLAAIRLDESRYPHYGKLPIVARRQWLTGEITKLNMLKHQRPDPNILELDVVALDEYIMEDALVSDLTQTEMDHAFRMGLKGDYGDYYGLTADALFGFLEGYLNTPEKKEATRLVRIAKGIDKPKSEGAVDYIKKVVNHKAEVWAERLKEWEKDK